MGNIKIVLLSILVFCSCSQGKKIELLPPSYEYIDSEGESHKEVFYLVDNTTVQDIDSFVCTIIDTINIKKIEHYVIVFFQSDFTLDSKFKHNLDHPIYWQDKNFRWGYYWHNGKFYQRIDKDDNIYFSASSSKKFQKQKTSLNFMQEGSCFD